MCVYIYFALWIPVIDTTLSSGLENLALNKPANQSSTYSSAHARLVNDGNTDQDYHNGSCSHTKGQLAPWWTVDLMREYTIQSLTIYNRDNNKCGVPKRYLYGYVCKETEEADWSTWCQYTYNVNGLGIMSGRLRMMSPWWPGVVQPGAERLVGFRVHISDLVDVSKPDTRFQHLCYVDERTTLPLVINISCASPVTGRYLTISLNGTKTKYLTLCEVQVYGELPTTLGTVPDTTVADFPDTTTTWYGSVDTDMGTTDQYSAFTKQITFATPVVVETINNGQTNTVTSESIQRPTAVIDGSESTGYSLSASFASRFDGSESTDYSLSTSFEPRFVSHTSFAVVDSSYVGQVPATMDLLQEVTSGSSTVSYVSTVSIVQSMCCCSSKPSPVTADNFIEIEKILKDLTINKQDVTKTRRKYVSAHDGRPSSMALGISFLTIVMMLVSIIVCDITKVLRDLKGTHIYRGKR